MGNYINFSTIIMKFLPSLPSSLLLKPDITTTTTLNTSPLPVLHQLLDSDTPMFQPLEKTTITPRNSGKETGPNTEPLTLTIKTAPSPNPTTGRVPNNAPNLGNAEVPDSAKEVDGAPDMMDVKELHSQIKLQDLPLISEEQSVLYLSKP